jgi:hypothetical protein
MTSSGEGMRKTRAEGELHLDRPLKVIVRRPREDLEEHGSSDSTATEDQHGGNSDTPGQAD